MNGLKIPRKKSKPEVLMMRVVKGGIEPADSYVSSVLRGRDYKIGDIVGCTIKKINNPKFNRLIHRIGQLCAANIEAFSGFETHDVLKRLQWESNTHCETIAVMFPGIGLAEVRYPLSWSFDAMDDGLRHAAARSLCRWIALTYWKTLTPEKIEEMAESFVGEPA